MRWATLGRKVQEEPDLVTPVWTASGQLQVNIEHLVGRKSSICLILRNLGREVVGIDILQGGKAHGLTRAFVRELLF